MVTEATKKTRKARRPNDWRKLFIEALSKNGVVQSACLASGIARQYAYAVRQRESKFAQDWEDAVQIATDSMVAEAYRRAVEGCKRTFYFKGEVSREETVYSDTLLMFLLKKERPEYRDVKADVQPTINVSVLDPTIAKAALLAATEAEKGSG